MGLLRIFGKNPEGEYRKRIEQSTNYKQGEFKNLEVTKLMVDGGAYWRSIRKTIRKPSNASPSTALPSVKTNLKERITGAPVINWMGHSSYLIRTMGINILVDPVLSGNASPFSFAIKSFPGSDIYSVDDLPDIDILIITHDHYDHLDYKTVVKLQPRVKSVCTSLGVGAHLRYWGYDPSIITELDWWERKSFADDISIRTAPARHFSGRTLKRNQTLWSSFILNAGGYKLFLGGDSGYDHAFRQIGEAEGPFDIAILEAGQYNDDWPLIHMKPEEAVQAAKDLKAKVLLPVHWGKFSLAFHPWFEPAARIRKKAFELNQLVTSPLIGESVIVGESYPDTSWWESIL